MNTVICDPTPMLRQKIPKDGYGPKGAPQTYYTSRVSQSSYRYAKFIKRLRAQEEDERIGNKDFKKKTADQQNNDFFLKNDRRSLINDVARRVDICMQAYEADLQAKRQRLVDLYTSEEKDNIRKLVIQAQSGVELVWQEKKDRLKFLLDKRKKEHDEKYKQVPLEKCFHVFPCINRIIRQETKEIQLYQMKEKKAQKMAAMEVEKMWHEVAMKESEALAARMEHDAIERYRRDVECAQHSHYEIAQKKIREARERQMLIEETKNFKSMWSEDSVNAEEAAKQRIEKRLKFGEERKQDMQDRAEAIAKKEAEEKSINKTWDSMATQGIADQKAEVAMIRQKDREILQCNRSLLGQRQAMSRAQTADEHMFVEEAKRRQERVDAERCRYQGWAQRTEIETRKAIVEQIEEKKQRKELEKQNRGLDLEYDLQLLNQLKQLEEYKADEEKQKQKKYQQDLLDQMAYSKLLKERERKNEMDEIEKCKREAIAYEEEIKEMLSRPVFSEGVHPFLRKMAPGLKMKEKCPCSKPDYCL